MTYTPLVISELALVGVAHAGVPNEERIVIRPTQMLQLSTFGVAAGLFDPHTGGARPLFDSMFWFPEVVVGPPSWILVYTGLGTPKSVNLANGETVVTLFWQRKVTVFNDPAVVPVLMKVGAAIVGGRL
jgi:hypothetical protein